MSKVWPITGGASSLAPSIAEAVLASGDQIVDGAREPRWLFVMGGVIRPSTTF